MTLRHLTHSIVETARISLPTLFQGIAGTLTPEVCDQRLRDWSGRLVDRAQIALHVEGLEHAPPEETFVIMSNHQSLYDVPVMFQAFSGTAPALRGGAFSGTAPALRGGAFSGTAPALRGGALPRRVRMVAKRELFMIPGWGRAMRLAGFVEVDRSDRQRAIEGLEHAKTALAHGTSIWIAPEGTRGPGDKLLPFKQGGFHLALSTGARILPLSIDGTAQVLSAHGTRVHMGVPVHVTLSAPIAPSDYGPERREALVAEVRRRIVAHLPSLREA